MTASSTLLSRPPSPTRQPRARQVDIYLLLDAIGDLSVGLANVSKTAAALVEMSARNPGDPWYANQIMRFMQELAADGEKWERRARDTTDMYADFEWNGR